MGSQRSVNLSVERMDDDARWNELLERSPAATAFHRAEALATIAAHSGTELHQLVGRSDSGVIGLFPVFCASIASVSVAFSPPPGLKVSYLGPAYVHRASGSNGATGTGPNDAPAVDTTRPGERVRTRFIDAVAEFVGTVIDPRYVHVRTTPGCDPRPFMWNGYDPTPRYTYVVDVRSSIDDLFMSFSGDLRENVRGADDVAHEVSEGTVTDIGHVLDRLRARHDEQGVQFPLTVPFVRDLYDALPDGTVRVFVCRSEGDVVGGQLTLETDSTMSAWQGVGDRDHELPVTDLLDWTAIKDAHSRGLDRYDLVGANDPRLCQYKGKYNSGLDTYYSLERSTPVTDVLKAGYQWRKRIDAATVPTSWSRDR